MQFGPGIYTAQRNIHPLAQGVTWERFQLDSATKQGGAWLKALKRGDPIMDGRNITKEWEAANTKLRETGGLCRDHTARDNYGWKSL